MPISNIVITVLLNLMYFKQVGVTHYFSFLKARQEPGYVPMASPREGMAATISYWREQKRKTLDGPTIYARLFVVIGITSCSVLLTCQT